MEGGIVSSSILADTKHSLGLLPDETSFDVALVMHINTVLSILNHLGAGPSLGFMINGSEETWDQFFDNQRLNTIKSYVYLRVRLLFDPPATGFTSSAFERQYQELEFRILSEVDV